MLILSPLREGHLQLKEEKQLGHGVESFAASNGGNNAVVDFPELSGGMGNLLDSIDFDDLFIGIHDEDVLPDLEMDSEILDFSVLSTAEKYYSDNVNPTTTTSKEEEEGAANYNNNTKTTSASKVEDGDDDKVAAAAAVSIASTNNNSGLNNHGSSTTSTTRGDRGEQEIGRKGNYVNYEIRAAHRPLTPKVSANQKLVRKSSSSTAQSKNSHGKRKVKVDWTPELHRRFVQAVEQLGVDKAVPSRILELMGIDCLTRHNIASHLQKYRSHRKHLLAREAKAASWIQRRQIYGAAAASGGGRGRGGGKSGRSDVIIMNCPNWFNAPTMGFPPINSTTPPMHHHAHSHHAQHQLIRPLHVWGHPSMDQSMMHMWPKHHLLHDFSSPITPPQLTPEHAWHPPRPPLPPDASYWHHPHPHPHHQRRFPAPPVPGTDPGVVVPTPPQSGPVVDFHPSKESIDAAIGDVLSKPWLPLPLRLRPPATESVVVELQRQGIPKVPPSCA